MAAAVVNGLTPVQDTEYECQVFEHVTGSSIGVIEIIVSSVYITLLITVCIVALFSWCKNRRHIPNGNNPLSVKSLLKQLKQLQRNPREERGTGSQCDDGDEFHTTGADVNTQIVQVSKETKPRFKIAHITTLFDSGRQVATDMLFLFHNKSNTEVIYSERDRP